MEDWLDRPIRSWLEMLQWRILEKSTYHHVMTWKFPFDIWMYREILVDELPTVVIEIGNYAGGSALFFADLFDTLGHHPGRIIAVDIDHSNLHDRAKSHPRITFIENDAVAAYAAVERLVDPKHDKVLVIEDASHTYAHTYEIMRRYSQLVTNGSMMIIEDTVLHNGVRNEYFNDPGAFASVRDFLADGAYACGWRSEGMEQYLVSWNPTGFLRKVHPKPTCDPKAAQTLSEARHKVYEVHRKWHHAPLDFGRFYGLLNPQEFIPRSLMSRVTMELSAGDALVLEPKDGTVKDIFARAAALCKSRTDDAHSVELCTSLLFAKVFARVPAATQVSVPMNEWEVDTPVHERAPFRSAERDLTTVGISVIGNAIDRSAAEALRHSVTTHETFAFNANERQRYAHPFCEGQLNGCRGWDDGLVELARHPQVLSRVEKLLGGNCIIDSTAVSVQWPGEPLFGPHVDRPFDKGASNWKYSAPASSGLPPSISLCPFRRCGSSTILQLQMARSSKTKRGNVEERERSERATSAKRY